MWFTIPDSTTPEAKAERRRLNEQYQMLALAAPVVVTAVLAARLTLAQRVRSQHWAVRLALHRTPPLAAAVVAWALVQAVLSVAQTHGDVLALAKRAGRITASMVPSVLFLSLKPSPVPHALYLELVGVHSWLGRLVGLFGTAHAVLYLVYFGAKHRLAHALAPYNALGVLALLGFAAMALFSLERFRRANYTLFYRAHYVLAWACVCAVALHARPRIWLLITLMLGLLWGQLLFRLYAGARVDDLRVTAVTRDLLVVEIPRHVLPVSYGPGSHIRLAESPKDNPLAWISPSHPYTVCSAPADKKSLRLLVRPTRRFPLFSGRPYLVSGPYPSLHPAFFNAARRVLLVAGGVGISFVAPVARELHSRGADVLVLWAVRSVSEIHALELLSVPTGVLEIYVAPGADDAVVAAAQPVPSDDIELDDLVDPLAAADRAKDAARWLRSLDIRHERLVLRDRVALWAATDRHADPWVVVCGGTRLVDDAAAQARRHRCRLHAEHFAI
ncbi:uncharacterized protein V1510DRAFT_411219 [Dipodascopsis tothii]|uniref:uncharacterized protein n=1 Tax=Dipodascopsis tothii TaxID=44089 RepID=UPI0034CFF25C